MLQRGKKSAASLSVVSPVTALPRLKPPEGLTESEAKLFRDLVAKAAPDHFVETDVPLIVAYAQAILLARWAFKAMGEQDIAFQTWQQAARTMAALATKLRLCPHSRSDPKTVGRRSRGFGGMSADAYLEGHSNDEN